MAGVVMAGVVMAGVVKDGRGGNGRVLWLETQNVFNTNEGYV